MATAKNNHHDTLALAAGVSVIACWCLVAKGESSRQQENKSVTPPYMLDLGAAASLV